MPSVNYLEIANSFLKEGPPLLNHNNQLLIYNSKHFDEISVEDLKCKFRRWWEGKKEACTRSLVAEVIEAVRAKVWTTRKDSLPFWFREGPPVKDLIPFANGILNVSDWRLLPPTPDFVCHYSLPYDYQPQAKCPLWLEFLASVYEGEEARVKLLQEWFGYCMTADISHHKMLGLVGVQRSGKGTILQILRRLVGEANATAFSLPSLCTPFGMQGLLGKQVALISEVEIERHPNKAAIVEGIKKVTGADLVEVNRKHQTTVSTVLPVKFIFCANSMPLLFDGSQALADRVMLLEHKRSFLGREDKELLGKLEEEVEGVAAWSLEGLRRLRLNKWFGEVDSGTKRRFYRVSASVKAFLQECCVVNRDLIPVHLPVATTDGYPEIDKPALYHAYHSWCERFGVMPRSDCSFHPAVIEEMPLLSQLMYRPSGKPWRYRGIALR